MANKMILAILNLYVAQVPPTKFWLNPTIREQMWFHKEQGIIYKE